MHNSSHRRSLLVVGASAAALAAWAAPAMAQQAAPPTPAPAQASTPEQTIVVTAEKRAANLQQVPEAVSAFTSKTRDVEGINTIQDITNFTPGLTYSSQLDRTQLRGIGRLSNLLSADAAVAVYSDDFYTTSTTEAGRDTLYVDRDEILRGPQGTLYGRNAIGGAINVISKRPTDTPYAEIRASYGNFEASNIEGAVSGPILPNLTGRVAASYFNQDQGYFKNLYPGLPSEGGVLHQWYVEPQLQYKTDKMEAWLKAFAGDWRDNRGGPGSLLFTPTLGSYDFGITDPGLLTFNPGFGYAPASNGFISSGLGAPGTPQSEPPGTPLNPIPGSVKGGCGLTNNPALTNIRDFCHDQATDIHDTFYDFTFHFIYHFDGFDVKYVTGYQQYHYLLTQDWDSLGVDSYQIPTIPGGACGASACPPFTAYPQESLRYPENNRWISHEITFSSTDNRPLQWIVGAYYFDEHYSNPTTINTSPNQTQLLAQPNLAFGCSLTAFTGTCIPQPNFAVYSAAYYMTTTSKAIYGQLDWHVTPTVKITGGLRYTDDHKQGNEYFREISTGGIPAGFIPGLSGGLSAAYFGALLPAIDLTPYVVDFSKDPGVACPTTLVTKGFYAGSYTRCLSGSSDATTGTAGVEWSPDRDSLYYVRYSRGYKAFAFNAGTISVDPMSKPEFINAYEGGIKKTFPEEHLTVDAAAFYYDYIDAEIPIGQTVGSAIENLFVNIPKSRSDGVEFLVDWSPIDHLNLSLTYSLDDTAVESGCSYAGGKFVGTCYVDAADPEGLLPGAHPIGPMQITATGPQQVQSVKGNELPQAPRNKLAFNANYTWVFDPGNLTLSGSFVWKDKMYAGVFERAAESAPSWDEVDLNLMWSGDHDKYEILAYVKNLFDTIGYDAAGAGVPLNNGYNMITVGGQQYPEIRTADAYDLTPPRTYGVEVRYKFF